MKNHHLQIRQINNLLLSFLLAQTCVAWIPTNAPARPITGQGCRGSGSHQLSSGAGLFYLRTTHEADSNRLILSATNDDQGPSQKKKKRKRKKKAVKETTTTISAADATTKATPLTTPPTAVAAAGTPPTPKVAVTTPPPVNTLPRNLPFDYAERRGFDESLLGDLTGGRPGAIIETAEQLQLKEQILSEIDDRGYDPEVMDDYGELVELAEAEYDIDDPDAVDAATLGTWTIFDLQTKFDYEWDPLSGDPDPNEVALQKDRTLAENPKDEDGIEIGFTSYFGPSNPIDTRTILGTKDSYMVDPASRDVTRLTPQFAPDDLEIEFNENFVKFRQSLDIMETYIDPFLPESIPVPRHVAKWHGYPEQTHFRPQNYTNNRFTPIDKKTDFDSLPPYQARKLAVQMARAQNAEWMTPDVHQARHAQIREPYEKVQTLVGTIRKGEIDPDIELQMQPALKILGSCVELLSTWQDEETGGIVIRFYYHGLMKNKYGMKCWTESLLEEECGMMNVNNVIFETGFRRRDPAYDGGDYFYGPSSS